MADIQDLAVVDASNTGRWPENMQFSAVNNAGRADEGLLARWFKDTNASVVASGAAGAFTATSNRTIASYFDGLVMAFAANHTITATGATFNLNGIGAKTIKRFNGDGLAAGDITSGQPVMVIYKSSPDCWYMMTAAASLATGSTYFDFTETTLPASAGANTARVFAFDVAGVTHLRWRDDIGTVHMLTNATEADMEAESAQTIVRPDRQNRHPGHPKAGGNFNGSGTPAFRSGDYGMGAITDNGVGSYTLAFDTAFGDTNYWCTAWARFNSATPRGLCTALSTDTKTVSAFQVTTCDGANASNADLTEVGITFWGDYA